MANKEKILQQGAEAVIILKGKELIKRRIEKSYRLKEIDNSIRNKRTRSEAKLLQKASKIIPVPNVIGVDEEKTEISMDFVDGLKLSDKLDSFPFAKQKKILKNIGESISKLHDEGIIHGDLTTSNMILVEGKRGDKNFRVFLIDFGLGFYSSKAEDKAVDIHLLKQALEARHFSHWEALFVEFLEGYSSSRYNSVVIQQLKKVEARGRYKEKY